MPLPFKITYRIPAYGNNKLHADVFLDKIKMWLNENVEKDGYKLYKKYIAGEQYLPIITGKANSYPFVYHDATYRVRMLFSKEEDRNLFQLLYNTELKQFGASHIETSIMR